MVALPAHCHHCFDAVLSHLHRRPLPSPSFENDSFPLFVTWKTRSGRSEQLRGCIGTFSPQPLHQGLPQYAVSAAMRDSRFPPVRVEEVPSLRCSVSLLTDFEEAEDVLDWEPGTHGIIIEFEDPDTGKARRATYLPEVCTEMGWSKDSCLSSLFHKAGYRGHVSARLLEATSLQRYRSSKAHLDYTAYLAASL